MGNLQIMDKDTALKMAIEAMKWLRTRPDGTILPETQAEKDMQRSIRKPRAGLRKAWA
jgi:uncharacterized protein YeaC (DUF1315 family)